MTNYIFTLLFGFGVLVASVSSTAVIDPSLTRFFGSGDGEGQNVMVSFTRSIQSVFDQVNAMSFTSLLDKRNVLTGLQESFTNAVQGPLKTFLSLQGVNFQSFWISNNMIIPNASPSLITAISMVPGVAKVEKEPEVPLHIPGKVPAPEKLSGRLRRQDTVEWGIEKIRANQLWDRYNGSGIVVANIDTGVRHTHEALGGRWRTSHGWLDPYFFTRTPNDFNGHGTHTMGTIAGGQGIGVAPGAQWIACRGCGFLSCRAGQLLSCGQWIQCPTQPNGSDRNCSMAPHLVSNSWGGGQNDAWYDMVIESWQVSGITPLVSIGNSGSGCNTANSPGDRPNVIGVGSTDKDNQISDFSSRGPTADGRVKPDISAPGGDVRSAWWTSDRDYRTISGTSMACPHVAGVVALMKQKNSALSYKEIYNAITGTAVTGSLKLGSQSCGGKNAGDFPNNQFGYGLIDAVDSVGAV